MMANFVKVETNVHFCPLVSRGESVYFIQVDELARPSKGKGLYPDQNFCLKSQKIRRINQEPTQIDFMPSHTCGRARFPAVALDECPIALA